MISLLPGVQRYLATSQGALNLQQRRLWDEEQNSFSKDVTRDALVSAPDVTIFALSSGSGKAAIAVIRISGPACTEV